MKVLTLLPIAAFILSANLLTGCESNEGPAEEAGKKIDNMVEDAGEKIDTAVEETGEKIEEAGDEVRDKTQ